MSRDAISTVVRKRWTRRDVFKAAPLLGVGAAGAALWLGKRADGRTTQTQGTCRFCQMHCGIVCTVQDGRLLKVEGDLRSRTRGFVCEHGYALRELIHSHERLRLPLVRRGRDFHEVSWDEALAEVATRLAAIQGQFGPASLVFQTGWPFVRHPLVRFLHRFAHALGTPNVATVASLCEASLRMGQALTVGSKYSADIRRAKTVVIWGANPWTTAPPFAHVVSRRALDGTLIVIDPVKTTLAKEATIHLSIRPGTDGALALGFIHVLLRQGKIDATYVEAATLGFDELRELAAQYPPPRVEAITGIAAADIERVANILADRGPTSVWAGLGVEHHEGGVQAVRAITSLEVLLGRFQTGAADRSILTPVTEDWRERMLPALYDMKTPEPVPAEAVAAPLGREQFPLFELYNREAQGEVLADAILNDTPYPVRALILWGSNALITASGTQRLEEAANRLELLVTIDPFLSASAQRSDIVLPASTFAESPDVDADDARVASAGLVPAQGEARSDWDILRGLAHATGVGRYFPWQTFREAMEAPHVRWMSNEALQPRITSSESTPAFGTPTGKAEFRSSLLERHGHPPLPVYTAPSEQPTDEFPLRLVTGPRARARINSQFGPSPSVRARLPAPELLVHPTAAAAAGITHGSQVVVRSPYGHITIRAVVTRDVHPECVVMPAGWNEANPNRLISPKWRDPVSGFPAFRSGICRLEPAPPAGAAATESPSPERSAPLKPQ